MPDQSTTTDLTQSLEAIGIGSAGIMLSIVMPLWALDSGRQTLPFVCAMFVAGCLGILLCILGVKEVTMATDPASKTPDINTIDAVWMLKEMRDKSAAGPLKAKIVVTLSETLPTPTGNIKISCDVTLLPEEILDILAKRENAYYSEHS